MIEVEGCQVPGVGNAADAKHVELVRPLLTPGLCSSESLLFHCTEYFLRPFSTVLKDWVNNLLMCIIGPEILALLTLETQRNKYAHSEED